MTKNITPAQYWRQSKDFKNLIGKVGEVKAATRIHASAPEFSAYVPYSYVVVDFAGEKKELMGVGNEVLAVGDQVVAVLRKMGLGDNKSLIEYGLKVQKIANDIK